MESGRSFSAAVAAPASAAPGFWKKTTRQKAATLGHRPWASTSRQRQRSQRRHLSGCRARWAAETPS
eukprot:6386521-Alexandrium_andersonii.AAC.1